MNRKEASFILANIDRRVCDDELNEALDMAIKALEQEPCEDTIDRKLVCAFIDGLISDDGERKKGLEYIRNMPPVETHDKRTETHACDYIHRQDVLDLAKNGVLISNGNYESVCRAINELPPVNPQPCKDAISRQAAIDALTKTSGIRGDALKALYELPPVNPTKTGHWIETAEEYYKAINEKGGGVNENTDYFTDDIACSECLAKFSVIDNEAERFDFCPCCGAKMVEPQERSDKA